MISDQEIETKAAEFQLRPLDVQKDYVYGWLLKGLFQRPTLAAQLILTPEGLFAGNTIFQRP